jgi:hypothetical protein
MSDVKISDLPQALNYDTAMEFPVRHLGITQKIAGSQFLPARGCSITLASSVSPIMSKYGVDRVINVSEDAGAIINSYFALSPTYGGTLTLMEGLYLCSTYPTIPEGWVLQGCGLAILKRNANIDNVIYAETGNNIAIKNICIDGNLTVYAAGTKNGIYFNNVDNGKINNCYIYNNATRGVYLFTDTLRCIITDNIIINNKYNVYLEGFGAHYCRNHIVANNLLCPATTHAVYITGSDESVNGCLIKNNKTISGGAGASDIVKVGTFTNNELQTTS